MNRFGVFVLSLCLIALVYAQKKDAKEDIQKEVCGVLIDTPGNLDKAIQCFMNVPTKIMQAWKKCKATVGEANTPVIDFVKKSCSNIGIFGKFFDCVVQPGGTSMDSFSAEDQKKITSTQECFSKISPLFNHN